MVLLLLLRLSNDRLDQLAQEGKTQENAPVKASSDITINAKPERIWALLMNMNDWPKWQSDITRETTKAPRNAAIAFTVARLCRPP